MAKLKCFHKISDSAKKLVMAAFSLFFILEILIYFPAITSFVNDRFLYSSVINSTLIVLTNDNRVANNVPILKENELLSKAARMKAEDMAKNGYFSHVSPNGLTPWFWLKTVGYKYSYAGENLAMNFSDSADIVSAWMKSQTHRRNIVNGNYKEIGVGVAEGNYKGSKTIFVVQFFASPSGTGPASGFRANKSENQSNQMNSFISSSLTNAVNGLINKVAANIHKVVICLIGVVILAACLFLLVNIRKNQKYGIVLAYNIILVGFIVFFFAIIFIVFYKSEGVVATGDDNVSINNEFQFKK